jgi:hypothetical protein
MMGVGVEAVLEYGGFWHWVRPLLVGLVLW